MSEGSARRREDFGLLAWPSRLNASVWNTDGRELTPWRRRALRLARTLLVLGRDLAEGQLTLRAMSLVYTTLLSIVPLLALSFSVLKAFGVHNQVQPLLARMLEPLGEQGAEIARLIARFIGNMNVGVLGALGLAFLLYTAVSLVEKIEQSLNHIWHVPQPRPLAERFSRYLSVLLVGPMLVFSALGLTATLMNAEAVQLLLEVDPFGRAVQLAGRLMPYLLVIAAFAFVYRFVPNTRVRLGPALAGGVVGGIAWQTAGWLFAAFVASSGRYEAIYSGFAILLLFLIWLYLSWMVLLFGASVAFYVQHPEYLVPTPGEPRLSSRMSERVALAVMVIATRRFAAGKPAAKLEGFAHTLRVPVNVLQPVLDSLIEHGLLVPTGDNPPGLMPARAPQQIGVVQVLEVMRSAGESGFVAPTAVTLPSPVDEALGRAQAALASALGEVTLHELANESRDETSAQAAAQTPPETTAQTTPQTGSPEAERAEHGR